MKEFTKSDLKNGMFVQYRNGDFRIVLDGWFIGDGHAEIGYFNDDLKSDDEGECHLDILSIYVVETPRSMSNHLKGQGLKKIWERNEQTPAQKEIAELKAQITLLQAQMTKLQDQAKALQSKL